MVKVSLSLSRPSLTDTVRLCSPASSKPGLRLRLARAQAGPGRGTGAQAEGQLVEVGVGGAQRDDSGGTLGHALVADGSQHRGAVGVGDGQTRALAVGGGAVADGDDQAVGAGILEARADAQAGAAVAGILRSIQAGSARPSRVAV